jgi:Arm domain-containing DNA-binding protein
MQTKISKSTVDRLAVGAHIVDTALPGFVARRLKSGTVTYGYRYRDQSGRDRWHGLGIHGDLAPEQARKKALKVAAELQAGRKPETAHKATAKRRQSVGYTVDSHD